MSRSKTIAIVAALVAVSVLPNAAVSSAAPVVGGGVPGNPYQLASQTNGFALSPDGATFVYSVPNGSSAQIFALSVASGVTVPLSGVLLETQLRIFITPDSRTVVFVGAPVRNAFELFSVPIGGGTVENLSHAVIENPRIDSNNVRFTPDSSRVVFSGETEVAGTEQLYVADVAGGSAPTQLHSDFAAGGFIRNVELTADGSHAVYTADKGSDRERLYATPLDAVDTTELSFRPIRDVGRFTVTHDGTRVAFFAATSAAKSGAYVVPISGGNSTQLSPDVAYDATVALHPGVTHDDSYVVFGGDFATDNVSELFAASIDGTAFRKLNGALVAGGAVDGLEVSPTDHTVTFRADDEIDGTFNIFAADAAKGGAVKLNPIVKGTDTGYPIFSADGSKIVFNAQTGPAGADRLYSINPDGTGRIWISKDAGTFSTIRPDSFSPEKIHAAENRVLYVAVPNGETAGNVYSSRIDRKRTLLLGAATSANGPFNYRPSAEGTHAIWNDAGIWYLATVKNHICNGMTATRVGTPGRDTMTGTSRADVIVSLSGKDTIRGLGGRDTICSGDGWDRVTGGGGADVIWGGSGADKIFGQDGDDELRGGAGNDLVKGGANNDTIFGGGGKDDMRGGTGDNTCDGGPGTDTARSCVSTNVP